MGELLDSYQRQVASLQDSPKHEIAIAQAQVFLQAHEHLGVIAPAVSCGEDGSIQLEWHNGQVDLEIEFRAGEQPEVYVWMHDERDSSLQPIGEALETGRLQAALASVARSRSA